jgi:putative CocE/NonD family hydrolase
MEPGQVYKIEVVCYPTSNLFQKGHRIRVDIASSNYPHFDVNPNTGAPLGQGQRTAIADNTVYHSHALPSHIVLPVVTG